MDKEKITTQKPEEKERGNLFFPPNLISALADEVAKRLPKPSPTKKKKKKPKKIDYPFFLDTSAIIDGRIFEVIQMGLIAGTIVVMESILRELKHIADSQDAVKHQRGRMGLDLLERAKKFKGIKMFVMPLSDEVVTREVDERLIKTAKSWRGRIVTCDYNLAKKASIEGIIVINVNEVAHRLKIQAVPGESLHVKVLHIGKDPTQGVAYLDDGTMIVIERGSEDVSRIIDVVISRVIQTAAGRILFSKKI